MKLWKRIGYFFSTKQRVTSFMILFYYKTEADETLGVVEKLIKVSCEDAIKWGYTKESDWDNWKLCNKVEEDISTKTNAEAEQLLKEVRKSGRFAHNKQGVWAEGKHIVAVNWDVGYPEFSLLTFEEYCKLK